MCANATSLSTLSAASGSLSAPVQSRTFTWAGYARRGLGTVVAAVLANVSGAVIFTVIPGIGAVLVYAALLRFTRRPARIFSGIAAPVLVLSVIPDFTYIPTVPGSSPEQTAILVLMHVVAAAVIMWSLTAVRR